MIAQSGKPFTAVGTDPDARHAQTARALEGAELLCIPGMGHDLPRAVWPRLLDAIERVAAVDDPAAASTVRLAR